MPAIALGTGPWWGVGCLCLPEPSPDMQWLCLHRDMVEGLHLGLDDTSDPQVLFGWVGGGQQKTPIKNIALGMMEWEVIVK